MAAQAKFSFYSLHPFVQEGFINMCHIYKAQHLIEDLLACDDIDLFFTIATHLDKQKQTTISNCMTKSPVGYIGLN